MRARLGCRCFIPVLAAVILLNCCAILHGYRIDETVKDYKVEGKMCFMQDEPCKLSYRRHFECRCPRWRPRCVGPGKYYDAKCIPDAWLMYGRLWVQQ